MRYFLIVLACLFHTSAFAGELLSLGSPGPAISAGDPLNTGPFNCSSAAYPNPSQVLDYTMPSSLQLKGVVFFPGMWSRSVADFGWRAVQQNEPGR